MTYDIKNGNTLTISARNHYVCFDMYTDRGIEKEIRPR